MTEDEVNDHFAAKTGLTGFLGSTPLLLRETGKIMYSDFITVQKK